MLGYVRLMGGLVLQSLGFLVVVGWTDVSFVCNDWLWYWLCSKFRFVLSES